MLETHRRLYNYVLAMKIASWETERVSLNFYWWAWWFARVNKANQYYARIPSSSARQTLRRLDRSYEAFFRRVKRGDAKAGFPRFKGRSQFRSFECEADSGMRIRGDRLHIVHVGAIRIKLHRKFEGKEKHFVIKRDAGKWYLTVFCEIGDPVVPKSANPPVGVDVGIESFLTTSDAEHEPNPRLLKNELPKLRRLQRAQSRKKRGGMNRKKSVSTLTRFHFRVRNLRREFHFQTALKLVRRYGLVAVESLNVQGMVRNRRLAQAISDVGWYSFGIILKHQAVKAGVEVVEVDARWTSQLCSQCGQLVEKKLGERWHTCDCGCSVHRDVNAARNILARGLARTEPTGRNVVNRSHVQRSLVRSRTGEVTSLIL